MMGDASLNGVLQALFAQLAIFQAALLAATAVHKLLRWPHFESVVRQFAGVPGSMAAPVLAAAALSEVIASALLFAPALRMTGATLAAAIWSLYLALIVRAVLQGRRDVDCGCTFGSAARPLGASQITRNLLLLVVAVSIAWMSARGGASAAQGSQLLGGIALLALYGALDQVLALQPLRSGRLL